MSFSSHWLALRAPFDARARNAGLVRQFVTALPAAPLIVDLGSGTGANALALASLVGHQARFRLVDHDPRLLEIARSRLHCEAVPVDLNRDLARLLDDADAITASALMDLVSASWFDGLADLAAARQLPLLFTLSVDGRHMMTPAHTDDSRVFTAFARDQRRDKGFGPALGPEAPRHMHARLAALGARASLAASDWTIGRDGADLMAALIEDISEAAARAAPADAGPIASWRKQRQIQIDDGALALTVGHQDLLALW